jgi:hypothetical protein
MKNLFIGWNKIKSLHKNGAVTLGVIFFVMLLSNFAYAYKLHVENNTNINYKNVTIIIMPQNFDASYGRYDLGEVGIGEIVEKKVEEVYLTVPAGRRDKLGYDGNVSITIIAIPEKGAVRTHTLERILRDPEIIEFGSPVSINQSPLFGLKTPDIYIKIGSCIDVQIKERD